jgi:hypothetical protein
MSIAQKVVLILGVLLILLCTYSISRGLVAFMFARMTGFAGLTGAIYAALGKTK